MSVLAVYGALLGLLLRRCRSYGLSDNLLKNGVIQIERWSTRGFSGRAGGVRFASSHDAIS
jgi:hypothetical protein